MQVDMDKKSTFYFLFSGTIIMILIMRSSGSSLITEATPAGIINLEVANTKLKVQLVLNAWQNYSDEVKNLTDVARLNTYLDFIFLLFYSLFLYTCCRCLSSYLFTYFKLKKWLKNFAWLALLAGFLDVFENFGLLISLSSGAKESIAMATALASILKWTLVATILLLLISGLLAKITERKRGSF